MTAYHGIVDQAAVRPGEWVAVFACGGVGLAAVNIASLAPHDMVGDTVALEQAGDVLAPMAGYETVAMSVITSF